MSNNQIKRCKNKELLTLVLIKNFMNDIKSEV